MTDAELEGLEALLAKAVFGTWKTYWQTNDAGHADCGVYQEKRTGHAYSVCRAPRYDTEQDWKDRSALIVGAVRALPSLISTIRSLREENAELRSGYDADIQALCEALWRREPGCEFVRLNYPQHAAELEEQS